ncbi:sigma-70 family RNA polymerase sigma factor [Priestia megaterium]|uniref:sigma-70 family RNA polymerase sigma factor n=1 Tax=Priestia megaterium TaxID=1404 RepID=UPI000BFB5DBE|nr:hypothetical protein [Priestia megaterium]PGQ88207.1 hypothetical protein COA18_04585 [Priestia megaterium]
MSRDFTFLKMAFDMMPGQLSKEEELQLVKDYQAGDPQAYTKLRISLRPLVEKAIADAIPSGNTVSASNLRMRADTYLPQILDGYDPSRGFKLNTYITSNLKGYLKNAVRENMIGPYVPRNQHDDLNRYRQSIRDAEMEYGRNPTEEQIRQFYPTDAITDFDKIKTYHVNSFLGDAVYGDEDDEEAMTFKDQFNHDEGITEDDLYDSMFEEEQNQMVTEKFTPTEQKVIDLVTKEGQPFVQVALSLGLSTADIRKIMRRWYQETQN